MGTRAAEWAGAVRNQPRALHWLDTISTTTTIRISRGSWHSNFALTRLRMLKQFMRTTTGTASCLMRSCRRPRMRPQSRRTQNTHVDMCMRDTAEARVGFSAIRRADCLTSSGTSMWTRAIADAGTSAFRRQRGSRRDGRLVQAQALAAGVVQAQALAAGVP